TLTIPQKMTSSAEVPKTAMELVPGTTNYKASIAAGGQTIPLTLKTEIKDENGAWVVNGTALTPQGEISDSSIIEKGSLLLKHRSIKQGPMTIELDVAPNKVSG